MCALLVILKIHLQVLLHHLYLRKLTSSKKLDPPLNVHNQPSSNMGLLTPVKPQHSNEAQQIIPFADQPRTDGLPQHVLNSQAKFPQPQTSDVAVPTALFTSVHPLIVNVRPCQSTEPIVLQRDPITPLLPAHHIRPQVQPRDIPIPTMHMTPFPPSSV